MCCVVIDNGHLRKGKMKYTEATIRASAAALRASGSTLEEIAVALGITTGIARLMTSSVAVTKATAAAAVARKKTAKASKVSTFFR